MAFTPRSSSTRVSNFRFPSLLSDETSAIFVLESQEFAVLSVIICRYQVNSAWLAVTIFYNIEICSV